MMIKRFAVILLVLLWPPLALADVFLLAPDTPRAQQLAQTIAHTLRSYEPEIISAVSSPTVDDTIINIGRHNPLLEVSGARVINVVPTPHTIDSNSQSAVFVFQIDPECLINQIGKDFPNKRIGYMYSNPSDPIVALALDADVQIIPERVTGNIFNHLRRLREREDIDVMLIGNDHGVYTSRNIRFVLEDLYRNRIPAVSLSSTLLNAGASIAYVPSYDGLAKQIKGYLDALNSDNAKPESMVYATQGEIESNPQMSKRYNLTLSGAW